MLISLLHRIIALRYQSGGFQRTWTDIPGVTLSFLRRSVPHPSKEILFLHGIGTSSSSWSRVAPRLSPAYAITCLDLPGFGFSRMNEGLMPTLSQMDESLDTFAERSLPESFVIVGHSLGGWLAARFALRHPDRVERLVLVNTAGIEYPGVEAQAKLFTVRSIADTRKLLDTMWYRYPWYFRPFVRSVFRELQDRQVLEIIGSIRREDLLNPSLHRLRVPVDVIWGADDGLMRPESVAIIQSSIPHARIHLIGRCGHIPQLERPAAMRKLLQAVLESA